MEDVSFRDKMSFDLFNQTLKNVRYAPDIAFEGKWEKYKNSNNIVISVINLKLDKSLQLIKIFMKKALQIYVYII